MGPELSHMMPEPEADAGARGDKKIKLVVAQPQTNLLDQREKPGTLLAQVEAEKNLQKLQNAVSECTAFLDNGKDFQRLASDAVASVAANMNVPPTEILEILKREQPENEVWKNVPIIEDKREEEAVAESEMNMDSIVDEEKNVEGEKVEEKAEELDAQDVISQIANELEWKTTQEIKRNLQVILGELPSEMPRKIMDEVCTGQVKPDYLLPYILEKKGILIKGTKDLSEVETFLSEAREKMIEVYKIAIQQRDEQKTEMRLNIEGAAPLSEIFTKLDNVSPEQIEQWKQIAEFDLPPNAKVKFIAVIGGEGLDMGNEPQLIRDTLNAQFGKEGTVDMVVIDNMALTSKEILARMEEEAADPRYDVIIPYYSSHGFSRSILSFLPEVKAKTAEDRFYVQNENSIDNEALTKEVETAFDAFQKDNPDFFVHDPDNLDLSIDLADRVAGVITEEGGKVLTAGNLNARFSQGTYNKELAKRVLKQALFQKKLMESSIGSDQLEALQKRVSLLQENKKFVSIFDNCFAGSVLNEGLADAPGTLAVFTGTSADQIGLQNEFAKQGVFMKEFFRLWKEESMPMGEAFVRADMKLNLLKFGKYGENLEDEYTGKQDAQNPSAIVRKKDKDGNDVKIHVTSVRGDPLFRRSIHDSARPEYA